MSATPATVGYCYDSGEDGETRGKGAARWTRDTGRVQLAVGACAACNTSPSLPFSLSLFLSLSLSV